METNHSTATSSTLLEGERPVPIVQVTRLS
jgi:hypothetical protein